MKFSNIEFINKAEKAHQNETGEPMFDYSKTKYENINSQVKIICKRCGNEFTQRAAHHLRGSGCKKCFLKDKKKNQPKDTMDFIGKSIKVHQDKYDYSDVKYVDFLTKVSVFCKQCQKFFSQAPNLHLNGSGCQSCGKKSHKEKMTKSNIEFIKEAQEKHKDIYGCSLYDYSKTNYVNAKDKVIIICKKCGNEFEQRPSTHLNGSGCQKCNHFSGGGRGNRYSNTIEFIEKSKIVHGDKYEYSNTEYINNISKVKIYCKTCNSYFLQSPAVHLNGYGCQTCGTLSQKLKLSYTNDYFIEKAKMIHKNLFDYSKTNYKGANSYVVITCKKCGKNFNQRASHHLNGSGCPNCIKSNGEKYIEEQLKNNNIDYISQKRFNDCKNKITLPFDFYLIKYNLCIEFDGVYHYMVKQHVGGFDRLIKQRINDNIKNNYCFNNNIKLYRIKYSENLKDSVNDIFDYIKNNFKDEI